MSAPDLRRIVRKRTVEMLFGLEYRPDDPRTVGGLIGQLFDTIKRGDDPRLVMGQISGHQIALDNIDNAMADMNEGKE